MYNENRKQKYLRYLAEDRGDHWLSVAAEDVFMKTEKIEEDLGADLCEWPDDYAETAFSCPSYSPFPVRFYQSLMIVLSYTGWCFSCEGVRINRRLLNIRPKNTALIRKRMVSGEEDLRNKLDRILIEEHTDTFDTVIRAFAWLSFAGVWTKDMESLRKEDVDLSIPAVVIHEHYHTISHYALYSLAFAAESETMVSLRSSSRVRRADCDALSRNEFGTVSGDMMERIFLKRSRTADADGGGLPDARTILSFESIFLSGIYCDIRREELRRHPLYDVMRRFYSDYAKVVKGKRSDKSGAKRIITERPDKNLDVLIEDYYLWNLAFLPMFQEL